jgi:hypothetical protein
MIRRSTIIVLVIFLGLVGLAYYLQGPGKKVFSEPTPTESSQLLFSFKSPIVGLRISKPGVGIVEMNKDSQGIWNLTTPPADATDTSQIDTAISQLLSLQVTTNLNLALNLDEVGLSVPSYRVTITLQDGTEEVMNVGKETPTKGNYYVQIGNRGIFIVSKYSLDSFLKLVDTPPILASPTPTEGTSTPVEGAQPANTGTMTPVP